MTDSNLELLRQADEAHFAAGRAFDEGLNQLRSAQTEESAAARKRLDAYEAVFAGGLMIERILKPQAVLYLAGFTTRYAHIFAVGEDEPEWVEIDSLHADSLQDKFATNVRADILYLRRPIVDLDRPQNKLVISFEVPGVMNNSEENLSELISKDPAVTLYEGELEAIEWRLPTEKEAQALGALTAKTA